MFQIVDHSSDILTIIAFWTLACYVVTQKWPHHSG